MFDKKQPVRKCQFSSFYIYTLIIASMTIMVTVSPKTAAFAIKNIIKFIEMTSKIGEPFRSIIYGSVLYGH